MEEDARQLNESMPKFGNQSPTNNGFSTVESVGMSDEEYAAFNEVAKAEAKAQAATRKTI